MKKDPEENKALILKRNKELRQKYVSPLVKWYQASMTMDEKFKFGLISYPEYAQWKLEHPDGEETENNSEEENKNPVNHTFWEDDDGDRENLSASSYNDFLSKNNLNIGNKNSVDVDALLAHTEAETSAAT